ncbi:MAG: alpha/beta hydrolase [Pseudomonadota bacterium]
MLTAYAIFYLFPEPFFLFAMRAQCRQAGLSKKTIQIGDHQIVYLTGGQGPPLVLLHGFGADKYHWPMVARSLGQHFTLYVPDLPGFGESSQLTSARYTGWDQVERIRSFVEALNLDAIHIGGNSMGGYFAALYAARYKNETSSLWLLAPAGVLSAERSELMQLLDEGDNPLLITNRPAYDRLVDMCFTRPPYVPGPFKRCICATSVEHRDFHEKLFADMMSDPQPLEEMLANSDIPTLIIWGDQDRILHCSGAEKLAAVMTNATAIVMDKMGHVPMLERPAETESKYLQFHQLSSG